ncbi:receptor activity-modifying protein 2 [Nothobranchius furzeri]|uniref:Receptor (G protein-coupled) activity modifying protein 2 n=2 Tax=Nothobranchius TaxID=28779 RepID=A0A8C6KHW6_NOTFU|nr:receptor activity-modifying protein 2 [Nothobranchius furzeri]KAF7225746.1 receptor (G protein-coupled) activity modifying protein 2 [Nothobranchius furzeri]
MNRALLGKMTATRFSLLFSGSLVTLLIWGCPTVTCQVNDNTTVQPITASTGYSSTESWTTACGNSSRCLIFCDFCERAFGSPSMDCLSLIVEKICLPDFHDSMLLLNSTDWCIWDNVKSLYSNFSVCTEEVSDCLLIPWPNQLVKEVFVNIHYQYFVECTTEEFSDPPPAIVFALVITPICLIPMMVSLVVLKTKNGDGTS